MFLLIFFLHEFVFALDLDLDLDLDLEMIQYGKKLIVVELWKRICGLDLRSDLSCSKAANKITFSP